ncbi:MAG: phytanoyl-CoA dioxygenase family protein [Planctomycetia bacterium]|nr:phytanoyl-CoA dioxygenase family protein [Planctomycetia bacterium]
MQVHAIPQLTAQQRRHYETFGFLVVRRVFAPGEVVAWGRALEEALRRQRGGEDFAGRQSERLTPLVEAMPEVFGPLLDDERLLAIVDALLGDDSLYTGSNDGNLYVGNTVWHIDGGGWHSPPLLKTTIYCDAVAEGTGCLSVLPGSQHADYFRALYEDFYESRALDIRSAEVPGRMPLPSEPGDVICFDHRLWHSAWGGGVGRRQFAYSWAAFPRKSWDETWLHGYLARINRRHGKRLLSERLLASAGPRRRQKLLKLYEMGL